MNYQRQGSPISCERRESRVLDVRNLRARGFLTVYIGCKPCRPSASCADLSTQAMNCSCERRKSRAAARSQAGAALSWTSERADQLFVYERVRKAAAHKRQPQRAAERAIYTERAEAFFPLFDCSLRLATDRAGGRLLWRRSPTRSVSARSSAARRRARSGASDDGGGFSMFAPPICRKRWPNNAFPFRQLGRRRRQPSEHRSERSEQSDRARCARSSERGGR